MENIHIHTFMGRGCKTTILCNAKSIEYKPERLSLMIALHSVADHYLMTVTPDITKNSTQFFQGQIGPVREKFEQLPSNKDRINFCCDILNKPHVFTE